MREMNQHPAPEPVGRGAEPGWPIGAVAERLGIAAPTLRSWDRRHGVGPSLRTSGNHRRYTELDIRRVQLMSRLTAQGVPAQSAADSVLAADVQSLAERLDGELPGGTDAAEVPDEGLPAGESGELVEAIVGAARTLDTRTLEQLYRQVLRRRDVAPAWEDVLAPALRRVGDLWGEGRLGVQSEHLCSELLQSELRAVTRANRQRTAGPPLMLASADDEQHHLPLLGLEAALARHGVASLFLGPRVPADALLSALLESRPRALFLWASIDRRVDDPFWRRLELVDWRLDVVVGGPGWPDGIAVPVPGGPVSLTRVSDFTTAVRVLVAGRDGGPAQS